MMKHGMFWVFLMVISLAHRIAHSAPGSLTYQGRIIKTDGQPLEYSSVSFEFRITNPSGSCVVYREQKNGVDMTNSNGVFDTPIGEGTVLFPTTSSFGLLDAFVNSGTLDCEGGVVYNPVVDDGRLLRVRFHDGNGWKTVTPDNVIRSVPFAGHALNTNKISGRGVGELVLKTEIPICASGSVLTSTSAGVLTCIPDAGGAAGTVNSIVGSAPLLAVSNGSGVYTVSANVGTTAGTLAAGNDSRIVNAIQTGSAAGGDLSGTYPNPSIAANAITSAKINDGTIAPADLAAGSAAGQVLRYSGTAWGSTKLLYTDLVNSIAASPWPASCPAGQFVTWSSASDAFLCAAISNSAITTALGFTPLSMADLGNGANQIPQLDGSGKLNASVLPTSVNDGLWTAASGNVSRATGNVGIGTASPIANLQVSAADSSFYLTNTSTSNYSSARLYLTNTEVDSTGGIFYFLHEKTSAGAATGATRFQLRVTDSGGNRTDLLNVDSTSRDILFNGSKTAGAAYGRFIIANGNVGIGTTNPGALFHILGQGSTLDQIVSAYNDSAIPSLKLQKARNTLASPQAVQSGDTLLRIQGEGYDGGSFRAAGAIRVNVDGTPGSGDMPGRMTFWTTQDGQSSPTERMRIDSSGNIGIGTTAPSFELDVIGRMKLGGSAGATANGYLTIQNAAGTTSGAIGVSSSMIPTGSGNQLGIRSGDAILFGTGGSYVERMRIDSSGNVGIGLGNPTYQLQLSTDSAAKPGTSTWTIASDERLKDIRAPFTRGLEAINGINTIYFNYKKDNPLGLPSAKEYVGIKAQDAQKAIPEAVSVDEQGYLHVTNDSIIWTAVNAIKELYGKFLHHDREIASIKFVKTDKVEVAAQLKARDLKIQQLEQENAEIKARLDKIETMLKFR